MFGLDLGVGPGARPGAVLPAPVDEVGGAGVEVVVEGVHAQGGAVVGEHAGREPVGQAPGGVGGGVLEGQGVAVLVEGPAAPGIALAGPSCGRSPVPPCGHSSTRQGDGTKPVQRVIFGFQYKMRHLTSSTSTSNHHVWFFFCNF